MKAILLLLLILSVVGCSYLRPQIKQTTQTICADVPYQKGFIEEFYTADGLKKRFSQEQTEHFNRLVELCPKNAAAEKEGRIIGAWAGQLPYTMNNAGKDLQNFVGALPAWAVPWVK